jgi:Fe(II)/alpha-ketoglutarate-dependent arginine beta-hydroxylase
MSEIQLEAQEVDSILGLLNHVSSDFSSIDSPEFLMQATPLAQELPRRLRAQMNDFRLQDDGRGAMLIRGLPVNEQRIGPTPARWDERSTPSRTFKEEVFLALCGTLLGDLVTWASEQDGHIVHNVLPIKEHEDSQLGWGSANEFILHVEDAFSPCSPDYLGLICMRNPEAIGTTLSHLADLDLAQLDLDTLFEKNYYVRPDDAHLASANQLNLYNAQRDQALSRREEEIKAPPKTAIFFGDRRAPYIRLDPPYTDAGGCEKSAQAMAGLLHMLNDKKTRVRLQPGDVLFIDNCRAVHGRDPFRARYDGTDRWLKRVKVTRDLRKSREFRSSASCRKIL